MNTFLFIYLVSAVLVIGAVCYLLYLDRNQRDGGAVTTFAVFLVVSLVPFINTILVLLIAAAMIVMWRHARKKQ